MTQNEVVSIEAKEADCLTVRDYFDGEVYLPVTISKEFLTKALLHLIENKVEFGLFHKPNAIIIAHYGVDLAHMMAIWSDRRWHIGCEDLDGIHYAPYELE